MSSADRQNWINDINNKYYYFEALPPDEAPVRVKKPRKRRRVDAVLAEEKEDGEHAGEGNILKEVQNREEESSRNGASGSGSGSHENKDNDTVPTEITGAEAGRNEASGSGGQKNNEVEIENPEAESGGNEAGGSGGQNTEEVVSREDSDARGGNSDNADGRGDG